MHMNKNSYKNDVEAGQDPGKVNQMCLERQKIDELRKIKASKNNTITVNNVERYSELEHQLGYKN